MTPGTNQAKAKQVEDWLKAVLTLSGQAVTLQKQKKLADASAIQAEKGTLAQKELLLGPGLGDTGVVSACFGGACFGAGTPLLTPEGARPIEQFKPGDLVLSRHEDDPSGAIEAKVVEEVFVREGYVLHLHVAGQVIRTTEEHPFYVFGKGWVPARELVSGDPLLGDDGEKMMVEGVRQTQQRQTVYNLRIASWHTYFVGSREWQFSLWAHNDYKRIVEVLKAAPEVKATTDDVLVAIAGRMPQGDSAKKMDLAQFKQMLETKLRSKDLLKKNATLSNDTAELAKEGAEVHGNKGWPLTRLSDPGLDNPYKAGDPARGYWTRISALNALNANYQALRLRSHLPGQPYAGRYFGLSYHLKRAEYYAPQGLLVEVERPTHSTLAGNGEWRM